MTETNRQIALAARPHGLPRESDFRLLESPMPKPGPGEALIRALYLSIDPYLRGRMAAPGGSSKSVEPGSIVVGGVAGQVIESNDPRLAQGDYVEGQLGWQEYAVASAKTLRKIDPKLAPLTTALYVLGVPGLAAYFGLLDICRPQPGETVLVSGAAGAVGSLVGQIAKIKRCRVIGIAGTDEKVEYLTSIGFESAFNYKTVPDYEGKLRGLAPNGIDVYFDNVGGPITDAAIARLNQRARVAVCGQISQYASEEPSMGPRWLGQLILKQARVEGFLVRQFSDRFEEAYRQLGNWLRDGKIRYRESVVDGIENAPKAIVGMLEGHNIGKQLVKVA
ncbi:MAG TPA: NADP-dependent oxidoreductase [Bryobacteraceae bacterium]|nr:NADP-dependent oxidoreductase [Bryobacteraceae bacterium]